MRTVAIYANPGAELVSLMATKVFNDGNTKTIALESLSSIQFKGEQAAVNILIPDSAQKSLFYLQRIRLYSLAPIIVIEDENVNVPDRMKSSVYVLKTVPKAGYLQGFVHATLLKAPAHDTLLADITKRGSYRIKNFQQASVLANTLCHLFPRDKNYYRGIMELLSNGIEFGLLSFSGNEKHTLLKRNDYMKEVIKRLNDKSQFEDSVEVTFVSDGNSLVLQISDRGAGFNYEPYVKSTTSDIALPSDGKGLMYAMTQCFDVLQFRDNGATVIAGRNVKVNTEVAA